MTRIEARAYLDAVKKNANIRERVIIEAFYVLGEINEFERYQILNEIASREQEQEQTA